MPLIFHVNLLQKEFKKLLYTFSRSEIEKLSSKLASVEESDLTLPEPIHDLNLVIKFSLFCKLFMIFFSIYFAISYFYIVPNYLKTSYLDQVFHVLCSFRHAVYRIRTSDSGVVRTKKDTELE